jgi:hypothetical protein
MKHFYLIIAISLITTSCIDDLLDLTTLRIVNCYPSNHQYGVLEDARVSIEFNSNIKRGDLERNFSLSSESGMVEGNFEWMSGKRFDFIPRYGLETGSRYIIEIPRTVEDENGNKMKMDFLSDFYVGVDLEKPSVIATVPPYTAGGYMVDPDIEEIEEIVVTFSKEMNKNLTESLFSLSPDVSGYFSWNAGCTVMTYHLTSELDYGTQYKLTIPSIAEDIYGNTLDSSYTVIFIIGVDFIYPVVNGVNAVGTPAPPYWDPDITNSDISRFAQIAVYFSDSMNTVSTQSAFSITPSVDGTFEWDVNHETMFFKPNEPLDSETLYTIRIATTAEDIDGLNLQDEYLVRFKTDADDSLHIRVGDVYGKNEDTLSYELLFSESPAVWPVDIDMGPTGENDYHFIIKFTNDNGSVSMNMYTILENILIEGFNPLNKYEPSIHDISWDYNYDGVKLTLSGLSNILDLEPGEEPVLYRLTIIGGENGVLNVDGNSMTENFVFEFREEDD